MVPIPQELLEQFERGNVLLFVGERIVRDAEGQVLVDRLAAQLINRGGVDEEDAFSFPEAAQAYEDKKGRQALVQVLRDRLEALGDEPQQAHRLIAALADCQVLVTTSLDRRLERAFEEACRPLDVVVSGVDVAFQDERKAQLYKLRGSIERPESLVLTEDDYEAFFDDQASISIILQGYLARKTILFLGYDLDDPHFKRLYRKVTAPLDRYARRAFAFGESPPPTASRWCERHGIEVVPADTTTFLQSLSKQLAARARSAPVAVPRPDEKAAAPLPELPYKLLDYYEAGDEAIFYGRERETRDLASLIHAHRLTLLYGTSGTGKTSLLLAAAVPRLERADPPYETLYVRALEDPSAVIRRGVRRKLPDADLPKDGPLVDFLHAAGGALGRPLVLLLDQFEEFFIRLSSEFRRAFVAELGALYDAHDVPVKVVISLREDWLASMGEIEARIPEVYRTRMRLLPLTREGAREAIAAPVAPLGVGYEPALVERLLDDLAGGEGELVMPPQLQLVCHALYAGLEAGERTIALGAYERLGGARGVLRRYLDGELARLAPVEGALARDALGELVSSQRTKAVKTAGELALRLGAEEGALEPVLEKLVRARLLRPVERADGVERAYELAHEVLIAEIALSPEAVARKEAEELLRQGAENWDRFGALPSLDTFELIDAQRERLRLDASATALMLRAALRHGCAVGYWLTRMKDSGQSLKVLTEVSQSDLVAVRQRVAEALGSQDVPEAIDPLLVLAVRDDEPAVRKAAQESLAALAKQHLPALRKLEAMMATAPSLRRRILEIMAALPLSGLPIRLRLQVLVTWVRLKAVRLSVLILAGVLAWVGAEFVLTVLSGIFPIGVSSISYLSWWDLTTGAFLGAAVGTVQWYVLRDQVRQPVWWVLVTATGGLLGWGIGLTMLSLVYLAVPPTVGKTVVGAMVGAVSGTAQWLILRRRISSSGWWPPANTVAAFMGCLMFARSHGFEIGLAMSMLCASVLVVGFLLFWLSNRPKLLPLGISLLAASLVWGSAVGRWVSPVESGSFPDAIPIEVRNQPPGTTFLPERFVEDVWLTISAPEFSWRDLRADKFTAWIDLEGRAAGEYEVPVHAACIDRRVRIVEHRPANVPVRLRREVSRQIQVEVRVYGTVARGYEMGEAVAEPELVTVTGPELIVEQVAKVTVDLDLSDRKETLVGTRRVEALQADEELVGFVSIEPSNVQITVPVEPKAGTTEVTVRPILTGTVAFGYEVADVSVEPQIVMLIGDPDVVREIRDYVETMPLDISGATGDVVERMPLDLPEQVLPVGVQGVKITVYIGAQQGELTILREPVVRGIGANLNATVSPKEIVVTLTGARPRLDALTDEDVYVYVDLVDRGVGQHSIELTYLVPEGLAVESLVPDGVDVEIVGMVHE